MSSQIVGAGPPIGKLTVVQTRGAKKMTGNFAVHRYATCGVSR
jgi:hypothetical protein